MATAYFLVRVDHQQGSDPSLIFVQPQDSEIEKVSVLEISEPTDPDVMPFIAY